MISSSSSPFPYDVTRYLSYEKVLYDVIGEIWISIREHFNDSDDDNDDDDHDNFFVEATIK